MHIISSKLLWNVSCLSHIHTFFFIIMYYATKLTKDDKKESLLASIVEEDSSDEWEDNETPVRSYTLSPIELKAASAQPRGHDRIPDKIPGMKVDTSNVLEIYGEDDPHMTPDVVESVVDWHDNVERRRVCIFLPTQDIDWFVIESNEK